MTKQILVACVLATGVLVACGDDSGGSGGSGAGSGGSGAGSGGSGAGSGGSGAGSGGSGKVSGSPADKAAMCSAMEMSGMDSDCTGVDEYVDCVQTACDAGYKTCLGANYKSGDFSGGMCESYGACLETATDCSCTPDSTCINCFVANLVSCSSSCPLPMCSGGGAGTGSMAGAGGTGVMLGDKTCADLEACCNSLADSSKAQCTSQLELVKAGGDLACSAAYTVFSALGCK